MDFKKEVKVWSEKLCIEKKGYIILVYALGRTSSSDYAGNFSTEKLGGIRGYRLVDGMICEITTAGPSQGLSPYPKLTPLHFLP